MTLRFGTAGIPLSAKGTGTLSAISSVRQLGLDAMELEFVQSVNISRQLAPEVKAASHSSDVVLTCHAPYYINLNALDPAKLEASKQRLLKAAEIAWLCGASSVAFHPAYYLGMDKDKVYDTVKKAVSEVVAGLKDLGCTIVIAPETTGKRSQFGDLKEILRLSSELDNVLPCIDYAHMHSREGKCNTYDEFCRILSDVESALGKAALKKMHIQIAGVNYSEKGELNHLQLKDSDLNYKDIVRSWKDFKIAGVVISESPNIEVDALVLKNLFGSA